MSGKSSAHIKVVKSRTTKTTVTKTKARKSGGNKNHCPTCGKFTSK